MNADLLLKIDAKLGEGAIWDAHNQKLHWVDIEGYAFNVADPETGINKTYPLPKKPGTVVPIDTENVLIAIQDGLIILNIPTGEIEYRLNTDIHLQHNQRFNDGKCDPSGRFWVGTLSMDGVQEVSSLYCVDNDLSLQQKIEGVSISNGLTWSFDGAIMYYIDTPTSQVVQYDFDVYTGAISNKKVVVTIPKEMGYPDGMTIDSNGMLWIALWDGFGVIQCDPSTGELLQKVNVPAPKAASCAFGGKNLDHLYITTASVDMTPEELEQYPLAGSLFVANVGATGVPAQKATVLTPYV